MKDLTLEDKAMIKKICILFHAEKLIYDGKTIIIPLEKWREEAKQNIS